MSQTAERVVDPMPPAGIALPSSPVIRPEADAPPPQDTLQHVAPPPQFRLDAGCVFAVDQAELPERCAVCGDSFELSSFRTIPGRIRYHVCREHVVAAASKLLAATLMILVSAYQLADPILDGQRPGRSTLLGFGSILLAGVAVAVWAIPLHAGRLRAGYRRLWGGSKALQQLDLRSSES